MAAKLKRKPVGSYHHPDLEHALIDAAIRSIREGGAESATLREMGTQLGVSRTAIYRHFKDKSSLLARVALEGFRTFRQALQSAVDKSRKGGDDPIEEMGCAYIRFALANQAHYKTMFGAEFEAWELYPELNKEAGAAFDVLLTAIKEEQAASRIEGNRDSLHLAYILWASVHGIATLGMSGQFAGSKDSSDLEELVRLHYRILLPGLRPGLQHRSKH